MASLALAAGAKNRGPKQQRPDNIAAGHAFLFVGLGTETLGIGKLVLQLCTTQADQFYGIKIEEFPAQIAQVALWLMDHQMNLRVSEEFGLYFPRIPLATRPHIVHGNALRLDWNEVIAAEHCSFALGNPPFIGYSVEPLRVQAKEACHHAPF